MKFAGRAGVDVNRPFIATLYSVVLPHGRRLRMDELRGLAGDIGLGSVRTVGSTGNLAVVSRDRSEAELEQLLERSLDKRYGKFVPVFVRTAGSFLDLPSLDPFGGAHDPTCVSVRLMRSPCTDDMATTLLPCVTDEQLVIVAGDLWIGFPSGSARSKLASALSRKEACAGGTFRTLAMINRICGAVRQLAHTGSRT